MHLPNSKWEKTYLLLVLEELGKTRLIKYFVNYMETRGIKYQVCAMTGCAALLLGCNARTIHSWSGIKLARGNMEIILSFRFKK
jgi:ATP-dependent DNA helicase PIF1